MLKKIWLWFVYSSADPEKVSMTVKGLLTAILPIFMMLLPNSDWPAILDGVILAIQALFGLISATLTLYGLVRKVGSTIAGENKVILGFRK